RRLAAAALACGLAEAGLALGEHGGRNFTGQRLGVGVGAVSRREEVAGLLDEVVELLARLEEAAVLGEEPLDDARERLDGVLVRVVEEDDAAPMPVVLLPALED